MLASAVTVLFSLENQQPVTLSFVGWSAPQWPVSVYILGALLSGLVVGPLLSLVISRRHKPSLGK
nr:LapA family protein [Pseudomonas sp. R5(2019)]